jgi:hypothetical protein
MVRRPAPLGLRGRGPHRLRLHNRLRRGTAHDRNPGRTGPEGGVRSTTPWQQIPAHPCRTQSSNRAQRYRYPPGLPCSPQVRYNWAASRTRECYGPSEHDPRGHRVACCARVTAATATSWAAPGRLSPAGDRARTRARPGCRLLIVQRLLVQARATRGAACLSPESWAGPRPDAADAVSTTTSCSRPPRPAHAQARAPRAATARWPRGASRGAWRILLAVERVSRSSRVTLRRRARGARAQRAGTRADTEAAVRAARARAPEVVTDRHAHARRGRHAVLGRSLERRSGTAVVWS